MSVKPLDPAKLYRKADLTHLRFETTADLAELEIPPGQERAIESLTFGTTISHPGYNLFLHGPAGSGRHTLAERLLKKQAAVEATPPDWVYVHNFDQQHRPRALMLPAGRGVELRRLTSDLIDDLKADLPTVLESEEYRSRRRVVEESVRQQQETAFEDLRRRAAEKSITLVQTPMGMALAPERDGKVIEPAAFQKMSEAERESIQADIAELQKELQTILEHVPQWQKELRNAIRDLNREMADFTIGHCLKALLAGFSDVPAVITFLHDLRADFLENSDMFLQAAEVQPGQPLAAGPGEAMARDGRPDGRFRRYDVNVIVENTPDQGAPVIYDNHPAHAFLLGRVEHMPQMGALVTDFGLIRPGSLHRANGGYLILDAAKLLANPYAYESLKRTLKAGEIRIELPEQAYGLISTVSLEPEPIPLNVKVALIGDRRLYYLLSQADPEFSELFKVAVDFEETVDWEAENTALYARMIGTAARAQELRPLNPQGVARVIEHGARLADDAERLTLRVGLIGDLLCEADHWAEQAGQPVIDGGHVQRAIDGQIRRLDRVRERSQESITRGIVLIDTDGTKVGQINGLSVLQIGNLRFGKPTRITARTSLGAGKLVDIEREVELGGPLHSKGVLILSAFLAARFASERPLSLSASIVFEQSYGGVDGDSASSTELYLILSALGDLPIKQSLAVTGSVNQHGQVQAIGGVNEKIEGFYDICKARGLTGGQGVLIPSSNVMHLMLRPDVVDAVDAGQFHVYPIETIDQGIELLTGIAAGEPDGDGRYGADTVNGLVQAELDRLADARRAFGAGPDKRDADQ